jgi:ketosteroid isomerase-like protein
MPTTREVLDKYYEYANAGDWDAWLTLFTDDIVMDEQLAGHVETLATLTAMMAGMGNTWERFANVPTKFVIDGNNAAVLSHISGVVAGKADRPVEAEVVNYFELRDGKIAYFKNVHDTRPFDPMTGRS